MTAPIPQQHTKPLTPEAIAELSELQSRGALVPTALLAHASAPGSALHDYFEWDDSIAARNYRLYEAGRLIVKVRVRVLPQEDVAPKRVNVRVEPLRVAVPNLRRLNAEGEKPVQIDAIASIALVQEAIAELVRLRMKYAHLVELSPVFSAVDDLARQLAASKSMQMATAIRVGRTLMQRDGLDRQLAAERAADQCGVSRAEVLEALRMRQVG